MMFRPLLSVNRTPAARVAERISFGDARLAHQRGRRNHTEGVGFYGDSIAVCVGSLYRLQRAVAVECQRLVCNRFRRAGLRYKKTIVVILHGREVPQGVSVSAG